MKIIKTANGNKLKLSKKEWERIGNKAGWVKKSSICVLIQKKDYLVSI